MMKKILALLLLFSFLVTLPACASDLSLQTKEGDGTTLSSTEENKETGEERKEIILPKGFSVGHAKMKVNPNPGTGLGGYGTENDRLSKVILDDLMLTCTAISDGENTLFVFSSDTIHVAATTAASIGKIAQKKFGVPEANVILNATHTHSGPAMANTSAPGLAQYIKKYIVAAEELMYQSLCDLESAEILVGTHMTEGLNYVRRYVSKLNQSYLGKNLDDGQDPAKVAHESEADRAMRIICFDRTTKQDVVLVNWQAHPTKEGSSNGTDVSPDYIGAMRKSVEKAGYLFSFHQGAGGNVSPSSKIKGNPNYYNGSQPYGEKLASVLLDALKELKPAASGRVQAKKLTFTATKKDGKGTEDLPISVLSIGDVAFAAAPCELHDSLGVDIRERSPFGFTFFCGYTNGRYSYIPASFAFPNGGYEVESCRYVQGTGEALADELVNQLNQIYNTK